MTFLIISFIAGVLTVLAPCILPLLPVVVGASASGRSRATPYIVVVSLGVSVIIFTYLLKVSTLFITIPQEFWSYFSGAVLVIFGISLLFPALWNKIPGLASFSIWSNKLLGSGYQKKSLWGDVVIGAALGPVFSSCSPTYFVILASVLPANFYLGSLYLLAYTLGLSLILLGIALLGEKFANKLTSLSDPQNWLRRSIGLLFILLGLSIAFGYEKKLETSILNNGFLDITKVENKLLSLDSVSPAGSATTGVPYKELVNPSGFVNTDGKPIKIGDYVGKDVILLDILTYSCINCQRTFPYTVAWYQKYKDQGLIIIGIHTPEFSFEKDQKNVEDAMKRFGITFPVVLDNDYGTWNAYGNQYWPRKYLIDIHGNIVYDHIGEGGYEETETKIQEELAERAKFLGNGDNATSSVNVASSPLVSSTIKPVSIDARSPETYFGSARNEYLVNGVQGRNGQQNFALSSTYIPNALYLGGTWNFSQEYAQSVSDSKIVYNYNANDVYFVASAADPANTSAQVEVWQDGVLVDPSVANTSAGNPAGSDVGTHGIVNIKESRLYRIIHNQQPGQHVLELRVKSGTLNAYTFTFG